MRTRRRHLPAFLLAWVILTTQGCTENHGIAEPSYSDSDGDGLADYDEVNLHGTDPDDADTDGDGYGDGEELNGNYDPLDADDTPYAGGYGRDDCYADYMEHELGELHFTDQHDEQVYFSDFCGREIFITTGAAS